MGHPVSPVALDYIPSKEQATCGCLHREQLVCTSHQSRGSQHTPVRVTQRHPPHGPIRAMVLRGIVPCNFASPSG